MNTCKLRNIVVVGALLSLVAALLPAPPRSGQAKAASIHPRVLADLAAASEGHAEFFLLLADQADLSPAYEMRDWNARGRWVVETLQATAQASQPSLLKALNSPDLRKHVTHWRAFWIVNAVAVRGDQTAAEKLAQRPEVAQIVPAIKLEAPPFPQFPSEFLGNLEGSGERQAPAVVGWNIRQIRADQVWALGYRGEGMVVANVDTGVEYTHPALIRQYRGNLSGSAAGPFEHDYHWFDPYWGTSAPEALPSSASAVFPSSHGTHVMGTQVGDDGVGNQIGVAPGARWIAAFGCCVNNTSLLAALQWMLAPTRLDGSDPNPDLRPHALQNSWGGPGGSLIFNQAAEALRAAGVFVSASAGNKGTDGCGSMGSPGDNPAFFSVGSNSSTGQLSSFSSRGPNPFRGIGPDVLAPGEQIRSAIAGGSYSHWSGTSMAGPHVAGAVALLWDANPSLIGRVAETADLLRKTAEPVFVPGETCGGVDSSSVHPNNSAGWGRLDVLRAVQVAGQGNSGVEVTVVDALGQPLAGAQVSLTTRAPDGRSVTLEGATNSEGRYEFIVAPGQVRLRARLFGYSMNEPVAVNVTDSVTEVTLTLQELPRYTLRGIVVEKSQRAYLPLLVVNSYYPPWSKEAAQPAAVPGHLKRLAAQAFIVGAPLPPASTDCSGTFELTVPAGTHTLEVRALGYEPQRLILNVTGPMTTTVAMRPTLDYAVSDSRSGDVQFNWVDARGGVRHSLSDDSNRWLVLPPDRFFSFFGLPYRSISFSSNGFLSFEYGFRFFHGVVPFEGLPNNAFYAYAEDLNPEANLDYHTGYDNGIYTLIDSDRVVIQYNEVEHWAWGNPETFQVILDLRTGAITVQYLVVSWPDFTTVGLEDSTGRRGVLYSYANSANLEPGLAVRFTPVIGQSGVSCQ
ncbi:MAG: S8 family serine peptidase [Caldilineales bacterium]|nr:S8 family serine peptidase [Caldilineales bacterium]MDW8318989.1 S8 family serine peptidase [Anaerolineae bacterium]